MTNAAFLKAYRDLHQELAVMERHLAMCGTTGCPTGVRSSRYDALPRGTNNGTAAAIQHQEGVEAAVQQLRDNLADMDTTFQALLPRARNYRDRCILRQYYQLGQTDAQVAECLCVSVRHANRLRSELLTHLDNPANMSAPVVAGP